MNAVYVLVKLFDQPISYEQVVEALPVRELGVSFADMRAFVAHTGLPAEVVRLTPDDLRECPLPAIALLERDVEEGGHFIVILALSQDNLKIVDGTTGAVDLMSYAEFVRQWRGYALISGSSPNRMKPLHLVSMAIGVACLIVLVWIHVSHRLWGYGEFTRSGDM